MIEAKRGTRRGVTAADGAGADEAVEGHVVRHATMPCCAVQRIDRERLNKKVAGEVEALVVRRRKVERDVRTRARETIVRDVEHLHVNADENVHNFRGYRPVQLIAVQVKPSDHTTTGNVGSPTGT